MTLIAGIAFGDSTRPMRAHDLPALPPDVPSAKRTWRIALRGAGMLATGDSLCVEQCDRGWAVGDLDVTNLDDLFAPASPLSAERRLFDSLLTRDGQILDRLRGAFAIALWDGTARRLLLAVDPFGFRRLYYTVAGDTLGFGSRPGAALAIPGASRELDPDAAYAYLNFGTVPAPQTMYRAVRRLPAGHMLIWQDGRLTTKRYWDARYDERPIARRAAATALWQHTEDAVRGALRGLDPKHVGAFLSGGTDSSTIVGFMSRVMGERVNAFSIGFAEERYNELGYAELAARHFDATHYTKLVTADDALACVPDLIEAYDEPFGNNSAIPTYLCATLAREAGIQTLLAGDGGDEIFGGNERYRREQILARYHLLPGALRSRLIEPLLRALPAGGLSPLGKAQRYVQRASTPNPGRFYDSEFFIAQERRRLLHPDFLAAVTPDWPLRVAQRHFDAAPATSELNRLLYLDLKITLADNDLFKVTRTVEAAGLAVRFPMLDPRLVEFTATLPAWHKVRGPEKRYLFKRAFAALLPAEILAKKKHGFGLPVADWLRSHQGFRALAHDTLLSRRALDRGYFAPGAVESLFRLHDSTATPFYGDVLWMLVMLEAWHQRHGDRAWA